MSDSIAASHKTGIGGSSAAAVIGCHRYLTKHDLYAEVVLGKRKPFTQDQKDRMAFGKHSEPFMVNWYERTTGRKGWVPGDEITFRSPEHKHMLCHPDWLQMAPGAEGYSEGNKPGVEIQTGEGHVLHLGEFKVAGLRSYKEWGDPENCEVPQEYWIQVLHNMIVTGAKTADFGVMIGCDAKLYPMKYSEKVASHLIEQEAKFWHDHVLAKKPPKVDESESAKNLMNWLYAENTDDIIYPENDDQLKILKQYAEVYRQANANKDNLSLLQNQIREFLKDRAGIQWDQGKITNKANKKGVKTFRTTLAEE